MFNIGFCIYNILFCMLYTCISVNSKNYKNLLPHDPPSGEFGVQLKKKKGKRPFTALHQVKKNWICNNKTDNKL